MQIHVRPPMRIYRISASLITGILGSISKMFNPSKVRWIRNQGLLRVDCLGITSIGQHFGLLGMKKTLMLKKIEMLPSTLEGNMQFTSGKLKSLLKINKKISLTLACRLRLDYVNLFQTQRLFIPNGISEIWLLFNLLN